MAKKTFRKSNWIKNSYKPIKIKKMKLKKNMKLGNKLIFFYFIFFINLSFAEDKITSTPLINLDKIKPSFEELNEKMKIYQSIKILKKKKN